MRAVRGAADSEWRVFVRVVFSTLIFNLDYLPHLLINAGCVMNKATLAAFSNLGELINRPKMTWICWIRGPLGALFGTVGGPEDDEKVGRGSHLISHRLGPRSNGPACGSGLSLPLPASHSIFVPSDFFQYWTSAVNIV